MRFLIDADLPRSVHEVVHHHGHEAIDARGVGLRHAKDWQIALYAPDEKLCLITGEYDFADIRNYPPDQYAGIVVLSIPRNTTSTYICRLLDNFLEQESLLAQLAGRSARGS